MRKTQDKSKKYLKENRNGITLVALVVTIIVLLILAGVAIATLTGDNGILTRAQEARNKTDEAEEIEKIRLAMTEAQIGENGYQELDVTNFQEALNNQFEGEILQLTDNKDGSFIINLDNMSKKYYADSTGQIISNENILEISTKEELKAFRDDVNSGNTYEGWYIYLTDNITLDINEEWKPIGYYPIENTTPNAETNKPFKGIFDGKGFIIDNIYINTTDKSQGLFGITNGAIIKNIIIGSNSVISGGAATAAIVGYLYNDSHILNTCNYANVTSLNSDGMLGGIAGNIYLNCSIENCCNYGKISGSYYIGGISGNLQTKSTVKNSYNSGEIEGRDYIGGIAGKLQVEATINNCYSIGKIKGEQSVGGILGRIYQDCKVNNSYYLEKSVNEGNDLMEVEGIVALSSTELKNMITVLGKNFKEDVDNINNGYPILSWQ